MLPPCLTQVAEEAPLPFVLKGLCFYEQVRLAGALLLPVAVKPNVVD